MFGRIVSKGSLEIIGAATGFKHLRRRQPLPYFNQGLGGVSVAVLRGNVKPLVGLDHIGLP